MTTPAERLEHLVRLGLQAWEATTGATIPERAGYDDIVPKGMHSFAPEFFETARERGAMTPRAAARRVFEAALRERMAQAAQAWALEGILGFREGALKFFSYATDGRTQEEHVSEAVAEYATKGR